jgi:hypothetical protein
MTTDIKAGSMHVNYRDRDIEGVMSLSLYYTGYRRTHAGMVTQEKESPTAIHCKSETLGCGCVTCGFRFVGVLPPLSLYD